MTKIQLATYRLAQACEGSPISTTVVVMLFSPDFKRPTIAKWGDYYRINHPNFTHWMPLPPAPAIDAARKGKADGH